MQVSQSSKRVLLALYPQSVDEKDQKYQGLVDWFHGLLAADEADQEDYFASNSNEPLYQSIELATTKAVVGVEDEFRFSSDALAEFAFTEVESQVSSDGVLESVFTELSSQVLSDQASENNFTEISQSDYIQRPLKRLGAGEPSTEIISEVILQQVECPAFESVLSSGSDHSLETNHDTYAFPDFGYPLSSAYTLLQSDISVPVPRSSNSETAHCPNQFSCPAPIPGVGQMTDPALHSVPLLFPHSFQTAPVQNESNVIVSQNTFRHIPNSVVSISCGRDTLQHIPQAGFDQRDLTYTYMLNFEVPQSNLSQEYHITSSIDSDTSIAAEGSDGSEGVWSSTDSSVDKPLRGDPNIKMPNPEQMKSWRLYTSDSFIQPQIRLTGVKSTRETSSCKEVLTDGLAKISVNSLAMCPSIISRDPPAKRRRVFRLSKLSEVRINGIAVSERFSGSDLAGLRRYISKRELRQQSPEKQRLPEICVDQYFVVPESEELKRLSTLKFVWYNNHQTDSELRRRRKWPEGLTESASDIFPNLVTRVENPADTWEACQTCRLFVTTPEYRLVFDAVKHLYRGYELVLDEVVPSDELLGSLERKVFNQIVRLAWVDNIIGKVRIIVSPLACFCRWKARAVPGNAEACELYPSRPNNFWLTFQQIFHDACGYALQTGRIEKPISSTNIGLACRCLWKLNHDQIEPVLMQIAREINLLQHIIYPNYQFKPKPKADSKSFQKPGNERSRKTNRNFA
ncbi:uncharacterized protein V1516DRAFT_710040 [Lipomyces oligophaga]|uniref:uncharacterized protein n=1 Tax=Lipomyces oligophaga TaxID=45792 RepID=UPI0034CD6515